MTKIPKARRLGAWLFAAPLIALAALAPGAAGGGPNLSRAVENLRATITQQPNNAGAWVDLGNLLQMDGRVDEAEAAYRRALEISPDQVGARFNLALLLQGRGASSAAYREYKRVLKIDPKHAWAHYQLGTLHEAAGRETSAIHAYAKAFALDPRLRFPDVNPHVIDNRYVTQATLEAYRRRSTLVGAPNSYEDPRRITNLLLGKTSDAREATAEPSKAPPGPDPISTPSPATGSKTIGAQDVVPGRSGVVSGGAATAQAPSRLYQPPSYQPAPIVDEEGQSYDEETDDSGNSPLVPGATFVPGVQSNGRLEIRWRSQSTERVAVGS
jgi:tetratricopeptide (TPR) repeat protein